MRLRLLGHALRSLEYTTTPLALALTIQPVERRRLGRPRAIMHEMLTSDLHSIGLLWEEAQPAAANRQLWRERLLALR